MQSLVLTTLLVVANVTGAAMVVPQVVRLHRLRVADGLSGIWVGVSITMNVWWVAYAIQGSLWGIAPVSAGGLVLYLVIAVQLIRIVGVGVLRQLALGALVLGAAPLPFLIIGGWTAAGIAIGLCYGAQFMPAAVTAISSTDLAGISPSTWLLAWIEAVIWVPYGTAVHDLALVVGGTGGTAMATLILIRLAQHAPRSKEQSVLEPIPGSV